MLKMKSALYIVAIFSLALVSCTERLPESKLPGDNGSDVITMIKATVAPLELKGYPGVGNYSWNNSHIIGIYGTGAGSNEQYLPVQSTLGASEAFFFGNEVGGDLTIYMPYLEGGIPAGQGHSAQSRTAAENFSGGGPGGTSRKHPPARHSPAPVGAPGGGRL